MSAQGLLSSGEPAGVGAARGSRWRSATLLALPLLAGAGYWAWTADQAEISAGGMLPKDATHKIGGPSAMYAVSKSEAEWKKELTPEQFRVTRQKGTERAFSGEYADSKEEGTYTCVCCGQPLFTSDTKFDSGTGWPSFWAPIEGKVRTEEDRGFFSTRTEVLCDNCGAHLGHVFDDGPRPTGLRYCMNSVALKLTKEGS